MEAQRELLDALMGKGRNRSKEDAPLKQQHWDDSDVCPYFLCAFCPNDLFVNTKSDLGQCEFYHVEELKEEYNKQPRRVQRKIEKKLLQYLYELVSDVDRRIRRGKERIALNAPSTQPNPIIEQQIEQKKKSISLRCAQLDAEINKLKEHIEILCNQGKIDDAEAMLSQVEQLEQDKDNLQNMDVNHVGIKDPRSDKNRFQICEICGVFQAVDDAEDRIARHFEGKQHKGFAIIREKIKELEGLHMKEINKMNDRGRDKRGHGHGHGHGYRGGGGDRDRKRRSRDRGDRGRHGGKRDRDRDRDRSRHKSSGSGSGRDRSRHKSSSSRSGGSVRRSGGYHSKRYDKDRSDKRKGSDRDRSDRDRKSDRKRSRSRDRSGSGRKRDDSNNGKDKNIIVENGGSGGDVNGNGNVDVIMDNGNGSGGIIEDKKNDKKSDKKSDVVEEGETK